MIVPRKPDPDKTVFDAAEACGYIGVSWNTLKKEIRAGSLKVKRVGARYLFHKELLDNFLIEKGDPVADRIIRSLK
ncbi:MAG: excisionase family DNA-binding protein [Nitrospiraceae bacterium]|nr:excisionase family DNA-binding protein [Nitrospiraceae bacterium]